MRIGCIDRLRSCIFEPEDRRMEFVLFRLLCLASTLLGSFVAIPLNFLSGISPLVSLAVLFFCAGTLLLLREACLGRYRIKALFFLFVALLNVIWFPNGASLGGVSFLFFCIFCYIPIFFRSRERRLMFAVSLGNILLLLLIEYLFPEWVMPYRSSFDRVTDHLVNLTVAATCCSIMLWSLLRTYDQEQRRLRALNEQLQQNVAERAEAEQSLLQNRELLHAVIEGTTDAIFVKDCEGRYLLFNSASAQLAGKEPHEVLGLDDTHLFPPETARQIMEQDRFIMQSNVVRTVEQELRLEGRTIVCEVTKGALHDGEGKVVGLFGISREVTEKLRMAEELRRLNEELERRVAERTARLEAAVREQETFSYSVSHDLRGPLRHINSYTAIVEEEFGALLPAEAKRYLEKIRNSSGRMGNLIDDLLELSRIGRLEPNKAPVNLSELGTAICRKFQDAEPARKVDLRIEPGLEVRGDRVLLGQMLENLFENAWKYSSLRDCARIELGRESVEGRDAFFVRDDGVGFDMAYQDKLFGAFQRLHGAEFEGTGIGLATVKRIVERHGGRVWAQGAVGKGATIYFTLPPGEREASCRG